MKRFLLFSFAILPFFLTGCRFHGYLEPADESPLPARSAKTGSGGELEVRDGEIYLRSGPMGIGAALGANLLEDGDGVVVANRLRAGAALAPKDRIVHAAPVLEKPAGEKPAAARSDAPNGKAQAPEPYPVPATPAALRQLGQSHPVKSLSDLTGYRAGLGWLSLDLGVLRQGSEIVIRVKLKDDRQWFPVRRWDPNQVFRQNGIELCSLASWPAENLPAHAQSSGYLVLRVSRDSPAARAGLRPLDAVANPEQFELSGKAKIVRADGARLEIDVPRKKDTTDLWLPFLFSFEKDGIRSHFGLGPFDLLFHHSSRLDYEPIADSFASRSSWSILAAIQKEVDSRSSGSARFFSLNPFFDLVRMSYWLEVEELHQKLKSVKSPRRLWGEKIDLEDHLDAR